jgi:hypothetical protein
VPNVLCPSCGLSSYAVTPHSTASLCPYCDAELFPRLVRPAAAEGDKDAAGGTEVEVEAA